MAECTIEVVAIVQLPLGPGDVRKGNWIPVEKFRQKSHFRCCHTRAAKQGSTQRYKGISQLSNIYDFVLINLMQVLIC